LLKTSDGGGWAVEQARELTRLGVETHVALPSLAGANVGRWSSAGAVIHEACVDIRPGQLGSLPRRLGGLRDLVRRVRPDVIHSHFVSSTILMRLALDDSSAPRIFQVPGPLHLEHGFWRSAELALAGERDYWIPSSRYVMGLYRRAGVSASRLFLSYYGADLSTCTQVRTGALRARFGIPDEVKVVGNANLIYAPKWWLGQRVGVKAHEDVIDALGLVMEKRTDVMGVLIGGVFGGADDYERRLRERASAVGRGRILMPGYLPAEEVRRMCPDFDVAVHAPLSENCGGVGEPILAGVPTIAGAVGGLPEVVVEGVTGRMVPTRRPDRLAAAILSVLEEPARHRAMAKVGRELVLAAFDVRRTAKEVYDVYRHLVCGEAAPAPFDHLAWLAAKGAAACAIS
jgi:glycosyltransferase involved in cell wall biosynthesis